MLESNGYEVWVSQRPGETVQNILDNEIDLVILDKLLSGMDGTATCTGIKENKATTQVSVLMMSALATAKESCMEAGADDFLEKPFNKKTLFLKIEKVLEI